MSSDTEHRAGRPRRERHDYSYSPFSTGARQDQDENEWWLNRELTLIENLLRDKGEMNRKDIGNTLGCKYWGPRRFARALKAGVEQGRFKQTKRNTYGPA